MAERMSLRLRPSRALTWLFAGGHVLASAALWLAPFAAAWSLAGSLALAAHLVWVLRLHAWRNAAGSVVELELRENCSVSALSRAGGWMEYQVSRETFVSPLLTVLDVRAETGHRGRSVLITPDSLDADSFRRLRVWLRWRCGGRRIDQGLPYVDPQPVRQASSG
jgi:toxin CptA